MSLIEISIGDLALSLGFIALVVVLSRLEGLAMERTLLTGTVRSMVQLIAVGYVLKVVFDLERWYWVVLAVLVMTMVAAHTARKRQTVRVPHCFWTMAGSIGLAAALVLGSLVGVILRVAPWYQPQYLIPLAGIILATTMNATALSVDRFLSEIKQRRTLVEAALALGAGAKQASRASTAAAFRAGMMPFVNTMMVAGIVALPGMMTGQILGGVAPTDAVRYQIVIIYGITAAAAVSSLAALAIVRRQIFTRRAQLAL